MKHFMMPLLREANSNNPLSDVSTSANPYPNSQKQKGHRKQKCPPRDKENSDPSNSSDFIAGKPPSASNMRTPLPPKPPNPLKRKLINDAISDILCGGPGSSSSSDSGVKVVVRMRPLYKDEENGEMIVQNISNDSLSMKGQTFTFDSVADTEATQQDMFQLVGAPLVENCLAGFNSSVFAYGQTGSGKTYTMWGPANALLEENLTNDQHGLAPRVFEWLFARINEEQKKHADKQLKYQCRCSFLEIYNEQITDLLNPSQKNLQIREDVKSGVYVENLTEKYVSTPRDVIHLLLKGLSNRRTGATSMNTESSRSHSVFTCVVESHCKSMSDGLSSFKTSRINLVDLAGSERQKLTGAAGERLKEAGNINKSLSQLGNLINILAEISQTGKHRHIPYRDSRLTFLLQESLGGNAKMAMICAVSPAKRCKSETFSTLRFAQRAKAIKNQAVVNEVMQDDVNFLREVIKQLKDELLRMKAYGNYTDPNAAYASSWNARRNLNLLKFSLNHPIMMRHVDDDGDEEMEIDEESVERLCAEVEFQSSGIIVANQCADVIVKDNEHSGTKVLDSGENSVSNICIKQASEVSDVIMEEGISEIDDKSETLIDDMQAPSFESKFITLAEEEVLRKTSCKQIRDESALPFPDSANIVNTEGENNSPSGSLETVAPTLSVVPCDVSPPLLPPTLAISPEIISSSRKSLRTSSMLTASQKDIQSCELGQKNAHTSLVKSAHRSSQFAFTAFSTKSDHKTSEQLAASLHRGLEILDSHRQSLAFRKSALSFSLKVADSKPNLPVQKVDVGIQASLEIMELPEDVIHLCSNCKNNSLQGDLKEDNESNMSNLELVPMDRSLSVEKPKKQVPKAVEKVLAGAIRREMAIEDFCAKQTSEIAQLNRLVQQYKHERDCNAIISQLREDKIIRLENLMDGVLPSEDFMEEELISLLREHELLKEKYENHPEVLQTKIEQMRIQVEFERFQNFFDMGERDVLLEEIHNLRCQLQYYTDTSLKTTTHRKSLLQPIYYEPSSPPPLDASPETTEGNTAEKLESERTRWAEVESQWICLVEKLEAELEASCFQTEQLKQDLEIEKKCSEELKEAMRLAMEGQARMLEQYADLEERHMQMLARQRKIQEGIGDVKKAAARAGVKRAELKFINAIAAEISALKVEREKERQYWRDEKKTLQAQLRDTAEAVQAAGEILVRLKEAEEAVASAEKRAVLAEDESKNSQKQFETLKKRHEMEISTLNQIIAESRLPKEALQDAYHEPNEARYDEEECQSADDNRWKEEFEAFNNNDEDGEFSSKLTEPSIWFSGYDKCNI